MNSPAQIVTAVLAIIVACLPVGAVAQKQAATALAVQGQLYVHFTTDEMNAAGGATGIDAFDRRASKYGVTVIEKAFPSLDVLAAHRPLPPAAETLRNVYLVHYASPHLPQQVASDFESVSEIGYAEPVFMQERTGAMDTDGFGWLADPDDTYYGNQTHLPRMRLPEAWDEVRGEDSTAVIAIVDGGTAWRHEDLEANVWTNPNEVADNGIDDDNNGFVDDVHGWNFTDDKPDPTGPTGSDNAWHGTAVAGTAVADTDNSQGIAGSSWNALFMGLNASCQDQDFFCYTTSGIVYAGMNGADVITASFGSQFASLTQELAIQAALDEGALVVASSGNDGVNVDIQPFYPSGFTTTLSVGGIQKNSDLNVFNYGQSVNVFAPSTNIDVTTPGDGYGGASGTSFAAPLVAGVAALVKTAHPSWPPERVREQIRLTAVNIDSANRARAGLMGRGKVDAYAAVTADPLPGVRVVSWSYRNQNGTKQLISGDQVDVRITFKNFHGAGQNISASLTTGETYVNWTTEQVSLGSMSYGDTLTANFAFNIDASAPNNQTLRLVPEITEGNLVDRPDLLRMTINETGVVAHATPALSVSITDEGNIGHTSYQGVSGSRGIGYAATTRDGSQRDVLFEGGLMIATSPAHVSDCIRESEQNIEDQQEDFVLLDGSSIELISPGARTSEHGRVTIVDKGATSPIGVEVLQESFVDSSPANEDFILFRYTITNTTSALIENMHVGLFFDWDIAPTAEDVTAFDTTRGMGYLLDSASNPSVVVGTRLLTQSSNLHYIAIDNAATIYRGAGGGYTALEKWTHLTGGIQANGIVSGGAKDVSQLTAAGPFSIEPQLSIEVAFAIISGTSESDFLANADQAVMLWDAIDTSTDGEELADGGWGIAVPYPHPVVFPAALSFETGGPGTVQLDVFDVLGRRVRQVLRAYRAEGTHTVRWDGRHEAGYPVASGLYMVRMVAHSGGKTYARTRAITVVQ